MEKKLDNKNETTHSKFLSKIMSIMGIFSNGNNIDLKNTTEHRNTILKISII